MQSMRSQKSGAKLLFVRKRLNVCSMSQQTWHSHLFHVAWPACNAGQSTSASSTRKGRHHGSWSKKCSLLQNQLPLATGARPKSLLCVRNGVFASRPANFSWKRYGNSMEAGHGGQNPCWVVQNLLRWMSGMQRNCVLDELYHSPVPIGTQSNGAATKHDRIRLLGPFPEMMCQSYRSFRKIDETRPDGRDVRHAWADMCSCSTDMFKTSQVRRRSR